MYCMRARSLAIHHMLFLTTSEVRLIAGHVKKGCLRLGVRRWFIRVLRVLHHLQLTIHYDGPSVKERMNLNIFSLPNKRE